MFRELFEIPFTHMTVKSYGFMVVLGFIAAIWLIRRLSKGLGHNPEHITNAALYSLVSGILGARLFYVVHHFDQFEGRLLYVFAVWGGGLELLGGVFLAIAVIIAYLKINKLPIRQYLDILAVALMLALAFGRVGCFLNGCCFGKPTQSFIGVIFPYGSPVYSSQAYPDHKRNRDEAYINLPAEYYGYIDGQGSWVEADESEKYYSYLKPIELLIPEQKADVSRGGKYHALPVHPTQLYSSMGGLFWCGVLYLFWRNVGSGRKDLSKIKRFAKPGCTFGLMFVVYGITRFMIEFVRDDNPFEAIGLTISQFIGLGMTVFGSLMILGFSLAKNTKISE